MPKVNHQSTTLNIRISPQVKALLERQAERMGISASEYVRQLIMSDARHLLEVEESAPTKAYFNPRPPCKEGRQ